MRKIIQDKVNSWASRVTVPQSAYDAAGLLLECKGTLTVFAAVLEALHPKITDDWEEARRDLERNLKALNMIEDSIQELLIKWGFNKDELNVTEGL